MGMGPHAPRPVESSQNAFNSFPSFDRLCSLASQYLNLQRHFGQTQIKAEHREGTQLILELLSVRAGSVGVWFITSGKVVQCVQTAKCDDVAMVA